MNARWRTAAMVGALLVTQCRGDGRVRPVGVPDDSADPDPGDQVGACIDEDGDGFGPLCAAGEDCDDDDAAIHVGCQRCGAVPTEGCPCESTEPAECHSSMAVVDDTGRLRCLVGDRFCVGGAWGECNYTDGYPVESPAGGRRTATGPAAACGNCDPGCFVVEGNIEAGDVGGANTSGTFFDPAAVPPGVVLDPAAVASAGPYAWIAMPDYVCGAAQGAVAKIRTTDGVEVARYCVGLDGVDNDPSRTAVDGFGNAFVASRAKSGAPNRGSVTKIAGPSAYCNNGAANTSTDWNPLPINTDDCVLWTTELPDPLLFAAGSGPWLRGLALDRGDPVLAPEGYVWAGAFYDRENLANVNGGRAYKLHPTTGAILASVQLPIHVYGAVADSQDPQRVWFSSTQSDSLVAVRVDTEAVEVHNAGIVTGDGYGVTYDGQRIWQMAHGSSYSRGYDPVAGTWCHVNTGAAAVGITVRMNSDGTRTVYAAVGSDLKSWDPDAPCVSNDTAGYGGVVNTLALGGAFSGAKGIGIAEDGRVLSVMRGSDNIAVWDPENPGDPILSWPTTPELLVNNYTYSDFTGYTRAVFTNASGSFWLDYGVATPVCAQGQIPQWTDLTWTATTPPGTRIQFNAQTADDPAALDAAVIVPLGEAPLDVPPLYVDAALDLAGVVRNHPYLRITAILESGDPSITPILSELGQAWVCLDAS